MTPWAIEALHLQKTFAWVPVLQDLSCQIRQGEIVSLFGPNGAGKTTLLRLMATLLRPTSGTLRLFGQPSADATARRRLGFLGHESFLYPDLTPVENLTGALTGAIVEGDLILKGEFEGSFTIPKKGLDDSDIRDSDFLAERRKKERLNLMLWNAARVGAAVLVLSLLLDITGLVVGMRKASLEVANEARRPLVEDIEASQDITLRILELGVKRLLPMEMLALVNEKRPATVEFTNIQCEIKKAKDSTIAKPMMTVDAKTPNAGDISDFLKAVQAMPEVEAATNSEPRVRDTSTTFRIEIIFKQAVLLKTAETPKQ